MRSQQDMHSGQVLVQVALMMVVLLGFLALAVDVSQVYLKRRQLQNAADAGALEGARQICFVTGATTTSALNEARSTALLNAPGANVLPSRDNWSITVVVTQTIPSFVASIVEQETFNPGARATAICGTADSGVGGLWPLSIQIDDFEDITCGAAFTVFTDQNYDQGLDCGNSCDCDNMEIDLTPQQSCIPDPSFYAQLLGGGAPERIAPGQRAWLNLFDPYDPYPDPTCNFQNCGSALACWLEQPHPGPVSVCDEIKRMSGVNWSVRPEICLQANLAYSQNKVLNVPLWGDSCSPQGPVLGDSCGDNVTYPVRGFGCIQVLGYSAKVDIPTLPASNQYCERNMKVVFARRVCPCNSYQGGAGSGPPGDGVRAVSLVE